MAGLADLEGHFAAGTDREDRGVDVGGVAISGRDVVLRRHEAHLADEVELAHALGSVALNAVVVHVVLDAVVVAFAFNVAGAEVAHDAERHVAHRVFTADRNAAEFGLRFKSAGVAAHLEGGARHFSEARPAVLEDVGERSTLRGLINGHRGGFNAGRLDTACSSEVESAVEAGFALAAGRDGSVGLVKEGTDHFVVGHAVKGSAVKVFKARTGEFGTRGDLERVLVVLVFNLDNLVEEVVDRDGREAFMFDLNDTLVGHVHVMNRGTLFASDLAGHVGGKIAFLTVINRGINNQLAVGTNVHAILGFGLANVDAGVGEIDLSAQVETGLFVVLAEAVAGVRSPGGCAKSKNAFLDHELVGRSSCGLDGEGAAFLDGHHLRVGNIEDFAKLVIARNYDIGLAAHIVVRAGNEIAGVELVEASDNDLLLGGLVGVQKGDFSSSCNLGEVVAVHEVERGIFSAGTVDDGISLQELEVGANFHDRGVDSRLRRSGFFDVEAAGIDVAVERAFDEADGSLLHVGRSLLVISVECFVLIAAGHAATIDIACDFGAIDLNKSLFNGGLATKSCQTTGEDVVVDLAAVKKELHILDRGFSACTGSNAAAKDGYIGTILTQSLSDLMNVAAAARNTRMFALDRLGDGIDVCSVDFTAGDLNGHGFRIGNGIGSLAIHIVKGDAAAEKAVNGPTAHKHFGGSNIGSGLGKRCTVAFLSRRVGETASCEENVFPAGDDKVHLVDIGSRIRLIGSLGSISFIMGNSKTTSRSSDVVATIEGHRDAVDLAVGRRGTRCLIINKITARNGATSTEISNMNARNVDLIGKAREVGYQLREILALNVFPKLGQIGRSSIVKLDLVIFIQSLRPLEIQLHEFRGGTGGTIIFAICISHSNAAAHQGSGRGLGTDIHDH